MRYALLLACAVFAGCGNQSPIAPSSMPLRELPTGDLTLRVTMVGHLSNTPLAGEPAHLRAVGYAPRQAVTNGDGVAEWQIPAGVYTVEFRHTAHFVDAKVTESTQWLVSLAE